MTPGIQDGMAITFYFIFWGAIFWMVEYTFAYVFHALTFSWFVVIVLAAAFSYCTVWADKHFG